MWLDDLFIQLDRKKAEITFSPHLFRRKQYHNLDLDKIEETIREGTPFIDKCQEPNKICFQKYFGKENSTYIIIVRYHHEFIEVKTAWLKKGR